LSIVVVKSLGLILLAAKTVPAIPAVSVTAKSAVLRKLVAFMMFVPFFLAFVVFHSPARDERFWQRDKIKISRGSPSASAVSRVRIS
jgi:hypothetical protein